MHLTGGFLKNRSLKIPALGVRPTSSKIRQAVFNILFSKGISLETIAFLDCCAGSGSMGFEALSRGAKKIGFIEYNKKTLTLLKANAQYLKVTAYCDFFHCSAMLLFPAPYRYEVAFIDPPYDQINNYTTILGALHHCGWLACQAIVVLEMVQEHSLDVDVLKVFDILEEKKYGKSKLVFLRYTNLTG